MAKAFLIHGFNVKDQGKNTTNKLEPYLDTMEYDIEIFSYGWLGLMGVFYLNPRIVKQLLNKVHDGDIAYCHSNGCLIAHMAAKFGAPFSVLVYINPALKANIPLPENVDKIIVIHTEHDQAVKMATWLRSLMPWAPIGDRLWGDMGARGYQLGDYRDSDFNPGGKLNKVIHYLNITCSKFPLLLNILIIVFIPAALFYWFILGPLEVLLTYYYNNYIATNPDIALDISRTEDKTFILSALVLPVTIWAIGVFIIIL